MVAFATANGPVPGRLPAWSRPPFLCPCCRPGGALACRLPLDPHRPLTGARVALPSDSLGLGMEPLRPSKARTTLAPRRGTDAARPPATPSAAGCAGAAPAVAAAATADGPRGARPRARAPTRPHTVASPRGPRPVKGPHGTSHKPPRGARRLVEVAAQTPDGGRPPAAAMRECASDARRGREGHSQGAVPTPCG